jgi:hypothetical protein
LNGRCDLHYHDGIMSKEARYSAQLPGIYSQIFLIFA